MRYPLVRGVSSTILSDVLGVDIVGDRFDIISVGSLDSSAPGCLVFSNKPTFSVSRGSVVIAPFCDRHDNAITHLISAAPRLDFIRALTYLIAEDLVLQDDNPPSIHENARIGENVIIENGCVVESDAIIESNAVICRGSRIGHASRIGMGSIIGADGFGFERDESGRPLRFPHLGGVSIGKEVEIGPNNVICRGAMSDTVIEDEVKTNSLVHIAHNCHIAAGTLIMASVSIAGGVRVGKQSWIGIGSTIRQKVHVGERAMTGLGSVVVKNIPDGETHVGNPARKISR